MNRHDLTRARMSTDRRIHARDRALRRTSVITKWTIGGGLALSGVFSVLADHQFAAHVRQVAASNAAPSTPTSASTAVVGGVEPATTLPTIPATVAPLAPPSTTPRSAPAVRRVAVAPRGATTTPRTTVATTTPPAPRHVQRRTVAVSGGS